MNMSNQKMDQLLVTALAAATDGIAPPPAKKRARGKKGEVIPREKRLEQNRKAAIESRRRKKVMVDELKRSVQYYTKANSTLKSQNAELERQLLMAKQAILFNSEKKGGSNATGNAKAAAAPFMSSITLPMFESKPRQDIEDEATQAQFAATQALYASMGYPSAAARAAASTFSSVSTPAAPVPPPQPKEPTKSKPPPPAPAAASAAAATAESAMLQSSPYIDLLRTSCLAMMPSNNIDPTSFMKSMGDTMNQQATGSISLETVEELNRFAMEQAAAANAAAAAATAAIKAANFHRQMMKGPSSSSPSAMPMFTFPFGFPSGFQP
jgi:hypothetical protein